MCIWRIVMEEQTIGIFKRFVDRPENRVLLEHCDDFIVRRHSATRIVFFICALVIASIITYSITSHLLSLVFTASDYSYSTQYMLAPFTALCAIIGGLALFTYLFVGRIRDILILTEFQNVLYANAAGANSHFFFIIDKERELIVIDENFKKHFASAIVKDQVETLDVFLNHDKLSPANRKKVVEAISKQKSISVPFTLTEGKKSTLVNVYFDPLKKPKGYFAVKAFSVK